MTAFPFFFVTQSQGALALSVQQIVQYLTKNGKTILASEFLPFSNQLNASRIRRLAASSTLYFAGA